MATGVVQTEQPKPQPKDTGVVETPKVETPKVETPKVETPKVETPKVENTTGVEKTPIVNETPKVDNPTGVEETPTTTIKEKTTKVIRKKSKGN